MSTTLERERARRCIQELGDNMPASLRAPLAAVRDGTEIPGTAADVLEFGRSALTKIKVIR